MICMKTTFITDINKIKFEVNTEVARLAFAGELDEKANEIPYKLIPGRTPHYSCCVYSCLLYTSCAGCIGSF